MKKVIEFSEIEALKSSIGVLKTYLAFNRIPIESVSEGFLNDVKAEMVNFYQTDDTDLKFAYLKAIDVALTKTIYDCPEIPQAKKNAVVHVMTSQLNESLLASKELYDFQMHQGVYSKFAINDPRANKLYNDNIDKYRVVRKTTFIKKASMIGKRYVKRYILTYGVLTPLMGPAVAGVVTPAVMIAQSLTPKSVKEKVKEKANKIKEDAQKAMKTAVTIAKRHLNDTQWGPAVIDVAHKVVEKTKDFGQQVKNEIIELKNKVGNKLKALKRDMAVLFS